MTKVTPTGNLILSADAPREAWLEARKDGITATDLPAILGLNKYKTAIDVWTEKLGHSDSSFEPALGKQEAALWGIALEDVVAKTWAEQTGLGVRRIGIIEHEETPWMRASLDRLVTGCPDGRCGLEVKTRSSHVSSEWSKGVPEDVLAQVRWQLLVSGLDHIHVIALLGGQRLEQHVVENDGFDRSELITPAATVWESVKTGDAPKLPEALWTDDYLEQLHPERAGEVEVDVDTAVLVTEYERVSDEIGKLEDRKKELRTQLVGALGEYEVATVDGRTLYTYKSSNTRRLDSKSLEKLYPDAVADDRVYSTSTTRTFRIATKKESK
jgi:putative phage-type endonuclease